MRSEQAESDRVELVRRLVGHRITDIRFVFADSDELAISTDDGTVVILAERVLREPAHERR